MSRSAPAGSGIAAVASLAVVGGVTSLVLAPQLASLIECGRDVSLAALAGLATAVGVGFGLVDLGMLRMIARSRGAAGDRWYRAMAWSHLPLLLLWLPGLSATGGWLDQAHLLVVLPVVLVWAVLSFGLLLRTAAAAGGGRRRLVLAAAVAVGALLAGLVLARAPGSGAVGFAAAAAWGLLLLGAFIGWGRLVGRLVLPDAELDWGQHAAWGLAVTITLGGVLNLTWSFSLPVVLLWIAIGVGAAVAGPARAVGEAGGRRRGARPLLLVMVVVAVLVGLAVLQYVGAVTGSIDTVRSRPTFDLHDDAQGYLVFVEKLVQLGSIGPEPFGGRRMLSLGAQPLLQAMVRVAVPIERIHLIDAGIAPLILLGLVLGGCRRRRLGAGPTLLLAVLILGLPHLVMRGNTSSLGTAMVLLVSWYRLLADGVLPRRPGPRPAVLVALTAAGLCALKSVFMPAALTLLVVSTAALVIGSRHRRAAVAEAAWTAGGLMLALLPWMLSILASSGTLLYPVLGQGFYGGVYTNGFASIRGDLGLDALARAQVLVGQLVPLLPLLLLAAVLCGRGIRAAVEPGQAAGGSDEPPGAVRDPRAAVAALTLAVAVNVAAVVLLGEPSLNRAMTRYRFPVQTVALICLSLACFEAGRGCRSDPDVGPGQSDGGPQAALAPVAPAAAIAVIVMTLIGYQGETATMYRQLLANTVAGLRGDRFADQEGRLATERLQGSIPAGETVLASLADPYLLDFARNRVHVMALPGMSSPPPGLPIDDGAEAVAAYLLDRGIRYVAYGGMAGTQDLLDLTEDQINARYPRAKVRWVMLRYHQRYREVVRRLARSRRRLYEDEQRVVLDLAAPACTLVPRRADADAVHGIRDGVWTVHQATLDVAGCSLEPAAVVIRTMGWAPVAGGAERHRLRVLADDEQLELVGELEDGYLLRLARPRAIKRLQIFTRAVPAAAAGALASGPPLGIDIDRVELVAGDDPGAAPVVRRLQPIAPPLEPLDVLDRSGWYNDFGWTDGEARLDRLDWSVPPGHHLLVLRLHPVSPAARPPAARVLLNEVELAPVPCGEGELCYRLYRGLERIERIRILSETFTPSSLGGSADQRRLGIPVRLLETRPDPGV